MRRLLRCKAVTIIAAIICFTAIPAAGIVATVTPALASVNICNVFGHTYCAGDPGTVNNGDPIVLTVSGRQFNEADQGFTCCGGFEVFRLQFAADTTQCMGVTNNTLKVTVRDCSGGNNSNVNWAQVPQSNGVEWLSNTVGGYLASDNTLGDQLFVQSFCTGCYFKWTN